MVKASDLVTAVISSYENGDGYIWGTYGQTWTEAKQKAGSKQNNAKTQAYGRRWINYTVYDCSGLPYKALKDLGLSIPHGCNSIWKNGYLSEKGKCSAFPESKRLPGMAVFLTSGTDRHHMGTYIGNGWVIEAKGTMFGVTLSRWEHWDECGYYKGVEYDLPADYKPVFRYTVNPPKNGFSTVRKGDAGPCVRYVQELLHVRHGRALTIDNTFGDSTAVIVRDFQREHGLSVDGVVGPMTIKALEAEKEATAPPPPAADHVPEDRPAVPFTEWTDTVEQLKDCHAQMGALIDKLNDMEAPVNE